jgi:mRNA-degrading endonuclease RelE of RelBE toxin-antitoxin system
MFYASLFVFHVSSESQRGPYQGFISVQRVREGHIRISYQFRESERAISGLHISSAGQRGPYQGFISVQRVREGHIRASYQFRESERAISGLHISSERVIASLPRCLRDLPLTVFFLFQSAALHPNILKFATTFPYTPYLGTLKLIKFLNFSSVNKCNLISEIS